MKSRSQKRRASTVIVVAVVALAACIAATITFKTRSTPSPQTAELVGPSSYAELASMPQAQLTNVDIALMNLLCAEGLPGAEGLDVKQSLALLDQWAEVARLADAVRVARTRLESGEDAAASVREILPLLLKKDLAPRRRFPGSAQRGSFEGYKEGEIKTALAELM